MVPATNLVLGRDAARDPVRAPEFRGRRGQALASGAVVTLVKDDVKLTAIGGEPRTIEEWLTTFQLLTVVLGREGQRSLQDVRGNQSGPP